MPVEKGKRHHQKVLLRRSTGEAEKYYQKRHPVTGLKHLRLLHGNVPANTSEIARTQYKIESEEIVTAF